MSDLSRRAKKLGVDHDTYERMLDAQQGTCAICDHPPKTRRLAVDHDHKTGFVRGLLCFRCNRALATYMSRAWLQSADAYLAAHDQAVLDGSAGTVQDDLL